MREQLSLPSWPMQRSATGGDVAVTAEKGNVSLMQKWVVYQLAILGLLWFCIMLHSVWPSRIVV